MAKMGYTDVGTRILKVTAIFMRLAMPVKKTMT